jgi:hypothetical protein
MLLALIMLTLLDGSPVWVESTQVHMIRPARSKAVQCASGTSAGILIANHLLCVRETPDQILKLLERR